MKESDSYGGFYLKLTMQLAARISSKMEEVFGKEMSFGKEVKSGRMPSISDWGLTHAADLKRESDRFQKELAVLWQKGSAMPEFNAAHFKSYQEKVREYGNRENKLINRYFKAMEERQAV